VLGRQEGLRESGGVVLILSPIALGGRPQVALGPRRLSGRPTSRLGGASVRTARTGLEWPTCRRVSTIYTALLRKAVMRWDRTSYKPAEGTTASNLKHVRFGRIERPPPQNGEELAERRRRAGGVSVGSKATKVCIIDRRSITTWSSVVTSRLYTFRPAAWPTVPSPPGGTPRSAIGLTIR
jgi:hypothetical protein